MARHILTPPKLNQLLKAAQARAAAENTRVRINDGDSLRLEVRPSGNASWQLVVRRNGKKVPITLGAWPGVSIAAARQAADKVRENIALGETLTDEEASAPKASPTVKEIGKEFIADKRRLKLSSVYLRDLERAFEADLYPYLGDKQAALVTSDDIAAVLRRIEARGAHVHLRRFLGWVRNAFDLAARHKVTNPCPKGKLVGYKAPGRTKNRPALRDPKTFAQLLRAITGWAGSPISRAALLIHAHTFVRPTELQFADWSSVGDRIWTAKVILETGEYEHLVPLTKQSRALFDLLRPLHPQFVVPGARYGKRRSETTLNAALHGLGYKGLHCTHGFRSSASTLLREMGWSGDWVERQLSHGIQDEVEAAYNKALYLPQRTVMLACWSDYLDALVDPTSGADEALPHEWAAQWHQAQASSRAAMSDASQSSTSDSTHMDSTPTFTGLGNVPAEM